MHTHMRKECCVCVVGVVCTHKVHIRGESIVCGGVEWVLCAHT